MYSVDAVQVADSLSNLFEYSSRSGLSHSAIGETLDVRLEGNTLDIVCDEEYLLLCIDEIVESDDTWMLQSLQDSDLSLRSFLLHRVSKLVLFVDFDRVFLLITLVEAQSHLSISTLTDDSTDVIHL